MRVDEINQVMKLPTDSTSEISTTCVGVRNFYFSPMVYIVIGVLSALVVLINSLAMISVLKNYRRLRQRIYVFLISLAAVEIMAGVIFFSDVMNRFISRNNGPDENDVTNEATLVASMGVGEKYVRLETKDSNQLSKELLEGFKAAVIALSVLNTALVTFALYKRTTSMGRHHEDFKNVNAGMTSDGHSFLPAFDTMLRVLSIGSPLDSYNNNRNLGGRASQCSYTRNSDSSPKRRSSSVSISNSSPQRVAKEHSNSISKDSGVVLLDKRRDQQYVGGRTPIVRMSNEGKTRKSSVLNKMDTKRNANIMRLMSTGRRVSQAVRSRSSSGSQPYVGRHSYSVMSKRASACSLVWKWLLFGIMCFLPSALRRSGIINVVCPVACHNIEVTELVLEEGRTRFSSFSGKPGNSTALPRHGVPNSSIGYRDAKPEPMKSLTTNAIHPMLDQRKRDVGSDDKGQFLRRMDMEANAASVGNTKLDYSVDEGSIQSTEDNLVDKSNGTTLLPPRGNMVIEKDQLNLPTGNQNSDLFACAPSGFYSAGSFPNDVTTPALNGDESRNNSTDFTTPQKTTHSLCSACSTVFFPLSKSHMIFNALLIIVTWVWLIISASRLLYLRKHSTNVFVRCSALWRFMFMTALFNLITLSPYVVWIILDFTTPSPVNQSGLWYTAPPTPLPPNTITDNDVLLDNIIYNKRGSSDSNQLFSTPSINRDPSVRPHSRDIEYQYPSYGIVATCMLLLNFAVAPTLYLVRLLGFRRIISAL